jgi:hypothetical protein
MAKYYVYPLDRNCRISQTPHAVDLESDFEALLYAEQRAIGLGGAEVWSGGRMVCRVPPREAGRTLPQPKAQVSA